MVSHFPTHTILALLRWILATSRVPELLGIDPSNQDCISRFTCGICLVGLLLLGILVIFGLRCHFHYKFAYLSTQSRDLRFHIFHMHRLSRLVAGRVVGVLCWELNCVRGTARVDKNPENQSSSRRHNLPPFCDLVTLTFGLSSPSFTEHREGRISRATLLILRHYGLMEPISSADNLREPSQVCSTCCQRTNMVLLAKTYRYRPLYRSWLPRRGRQHRYPYIYHRHTTL
ncbi:hypothetical protein CGRA01v4_11960 [Colletotrichum graminicola]|nr:hypothetical protein CGRA01v4_11960 [Colletotrichum graminicola]